MPRTYQPPSQHVIDALAAAIIVFVVELAQAIFTPHPEHTRRRIHLAIRRAERAVELMLLLMAFRLATPPAQRLSSFSRRNTPVGFRRRVRQSKFPLKHVRVRLRHGAFHQRIGRLIAAIAEPSRYVQRFLKRLHKGLRGSRLVASAPPARAFVAGAPVATCYADSS
ncbi:MAG: hypothetical protein R3C30_03420 [Hyphomonadaceae bacterium]